MPLSEEEKEDPGRTLSLSRQPSLQLGGRTKKFSLKHQSLSQKSARIYSDERCVWIPPSFARRDMMHLTAASALQTPLRKRGTRSLPPRAGKKRGESFQGGKKGHSSVFLDTKLALSAVLRGGGEKEEEGKRGDEKFHELTSSSPHTLGPAAPTAHFRQLFLRSRRHRLRGGTEKRNFNVGSSTIFVVFSWCT